MELLRIIENVLGTGRKLRNNEVAFHCPFCNHYKPKLQVNLESHNWHCWVCNAKGRKVVQLFRKLKVSNQILNQLYDIVDEYVPIKKKEDVQESISLPKDMLYLWDKRTTPEYKHTAMYLMKRGITAKDVLKYGIGYCEDGLYANRIIIPSYDSNGQLNYFVGRSFHKDSTMKYKNPKVSKDIIGFDLFINWNLPIVLCEGVFDAIAIKRNAIPLFGKTIPKSLHKKIVENKVQDIYIALDKDAISDSIKMVDMFLNEGRNVYMIDLNEGQDPSSLGFTKFTKLMNNTQPINQAGLLKYKLQSI
jgi:DNA primase